MVAKAKRHVANLVGVIFFVISCKPASEGTERQGNPFKNDPERRNLISAGERQEKVDQSESSNQDSFDSTGKDPCKDFDIKAIPEGYENKRKACLLHEKFADQKLKITLPFDEREKGEINGYCFDFKEFNNPKAFTIKNDGDIIEEKEKKTCVLYEFISTKKDKKCREGEYGLEVYCKGIQDISCTESKVNGTLKSWVTSDDKSLKQTEVPCKDEDAEL